MTGWIVIGSILLVLFLFSLLRLGVEVVYQEHGLRVWIRVGHIRIILYPRRQKKKPPREQRAVQKPKEATRSTSKEAPKPAAPQQQKAKTTQTKAETRPSSKKTVQAPKKAVQEKPPVKPPKQQNAPEKEKAEEKGGLPLPLWDLISLALDAAKRLISRLQIDLLEIRYTIGGKEDPAWAAIQYGLICAGEGGLVPVLENSFYRIKRREIQAQVDFDSTTSLIWLKMILSMRVGQLLVFACQVGWAVFQAYRNAQTDLEGNDQEGDEHGTETSN